MKLIRVFSVSKLLLLFFFSTITICFSYGQMQWQTITSEKPLEFEPILISSNIKETIIDFSIKGFYFTDVNAPIENSKIVEIHRTGRFFEKGNPDLIQLSAPIIIPDASNMKIEVVEKEFFEINNIEIAPSKGHISRNIDPSTISYQYGEIYQEDKWFPENICKLTQAHIFRDYRGAVVMAFPFQYNPVKKTLRVYNKIIVKVSEDNNSKNAPYNILKRDKSFISVAKDFEQIYKEKYINYLPNKYNTPIERGNILVISYADFIDDMTPYINWKNQIGFPTEIVSISSIGNNSDSIKNYVSNYYNINGLAYLLLVGDHTEIETHNYGLAPDDLGTMYSDNYYGDILGNDNYLEVIVGRFSANNSAEVQTQVLRTLEYEKATNMTTGWQSTAMGISRNEGGGDGHDGGESDCEHIDKIRTLLLNYNYDIVHQDYTNSCFGIPNTTTSQISARINNGVSLINYCNHGSTTSWSVGSFTNTRVNELTNENKLPFIWSVACQVGNFTYLSGDCFAESWLKATHETSGKPTGAVGVYMSTISQPWQPPMDAQDEFNRILSKTISGKTLRSYGAISLSGNMHMLDLNPADEYRIATSRTWTVFGDPSLMLRTQNPDSIIASHPKTIYENETNLLVYCNSEDAFVTLTDNYNIIGSGIISNGKTLIDIPSLSEIDTILITITAYNKIPYETNIIVETMPYIDVEAYEIINPKSYYPCDNKPISPSIVIRNIGIDTLFSAKIYYQINLDPQQLFEWTGNIATFEKDTILLPNITLSEGYHTFTINIQDPNDSIEINTFNNELEKSFELENLNLVADFNINRNIFCNPPASVEFENNSTGATSYFWDFGDSINSTLENPIHEYINYGNYYVTLIAEAGICGSDTASFSNIIVGITPPTADNVGSCNTSSFIINAVSDGVINWYDDSLKSNLLFTGNSFNTGMLDSSKTFFIETEFTETYYGGKTDFSGSGTYLSSENNYGMVFSCVSPTLLKSVKVYSSSSLEREIILKNSEDSIIASKTLVIPEGEQRVTLNFNIPNDSNMRLLLNSTSYLYLNADMAINYPFSVGNNIQIIESSLQDYKYSTYFYFYDWEVEEKCYSDLNSVDALILDPPTADFSFTINNDTANFTNNSFGDYLTYLWDFGDETTSDEENPIHIYLINDSYNVKLITSNLCSSDSISKQIIVPTHKENIENYTFFNIYPNPAKNFLIVESSQIIKYLKIYDINGQIIKIFEPNNKSLFLDIKDLNSGLYFIKAISEKNFFIEKLTITK